MIKKTIHVIINTKGGWSIHRYGAGRANKVFSTQAEAVRYAKNMARDEGTNLYIHRSDGTVKEKNIYNSSNFAHSG